MLKLLKATTPMAFLFLSFFRINSIIEAFVRRGLYERVYDKLWAVGSKSNMCI